MLFSFLNQCGESDFIRGGGGVNENKEQEEKKVVQRQTDGFRGLTLALKSDQSTFQPKSKCHPAHIPVNVPLMSLESEACSVVANFSCYSPSLAHQPLVSVVVYLRSKWKPSVATGRKGGGIPRS